MSDVGVGGEKDIYGPRGGARVPSRSACTVSFPPEQKGIGGDEAVHASRDTECAAGRAPQTRFRSNFPKF